MTKLLRHLALGATLFGALLFGTTSSAWAQGPSTTIVNNGNNNINIVLNIQGPKINVNVPGFPGMPGFPGGPIGPSGPGCSHPSHGGFGPGFPGAQTTIFNQGHGNFNQVSNRGGAGPAQTQIVNFGNGNRNVVRYR